MAIAVKNADAAASDTITLPTHATDDIFLAIATTESHTGSAITLPSGWVNIVNGNTTENFEYRVAYLVCTSASMSNPTFTNAANVAVVNYSGCDTTDPIGGEGTFQSGADASPAWASGTLEKTDSTSWLIRVSGHGHGEATFAQLPTGLTARVNEWPGYNNGNVTVLMGDSNAGVSSWGSDSTTESWEDWWTHAFELLEASSGSVSVNPRGVIIPQAIVRASYW